MGLVGVLENVAASHLAGTWIVVPNNGDVAVAQLIHLCVLGQPLPQDLLHYFSLEVSKQ